MLDDLEDLEGEFDARNLDCGLSDTDQDAPTDTPNDQEPEPTPTQTAPAPQRTTRRTRVAPHYTLPPRLAARGIACVIIQFRDGRRRVLT